MDFFFGNLGAKLKKHKKMILSGKNDLSIHPFGIIDDLMPLWIHFSKIVTYVASLRIPPVGVNLVGITFENAWHRRSRVHGCPAKLSHYYAGH